ncbi:hypothetical protein PS928_02956 [Pseudomonas fluorescens]|uniref:Uncharacterized protein n=1 Tax=Pseudomonas fluorescens TaxID=294 RepID=A0A5E7U100_PSEFL|nr:hypothetical protein PS928_02956 [Pseudomonas fluorescens]
MTQAAGCGLGCHFLLDVAFFHDELVGFRSSRKILTNQRRQIRSRLHIHDPIIFFRAKVQLKCPDKLGEALFGRRAGYAIPVSLEQLQQFGPGWNAGLDILLLNGISSGLVEPGTDAFQVKRMPGKLRPRVTFAPDRNIAVAQNTGGVDARIAFKDVQRQLYNCCNLCWMIRR